MEEQVIIHKDSKYKVVYKRSAAKGIDGFKVEVNGDCLDEVDIQAQALYEAAKLVAITLPPPTSQIKKGGRTWRMK